jgi:hypothetical protein
MHEASIRLKERFDLRYKEDDQLTTDDDLIVLKAVRELIDRAEQLEARVRRLLHEVDLTDAY